MVGKDQSAAADDFPGAASVENDNGIFKGSLVDAVELFAGKLQAFFYHIIVDLLAKQHGKPHAFFGHGSYQGTQ